jgi:hypothetical protein
MLPFELARKTEAVYKTAQICLNGHLISKDTSFNYYPLEKFCSKCGAASIEACANCKSPIRGNCQIGINMEPLVRIPAFCHACGKPFPWTEAALEAAREYADDLDQLSLADRAKLKETFTDLTADSPKTVLAVTRFQKFMNAVGKPAATAMTQILVSVFTDEAKKQLGLK